MSNMKYTSCKTKIVAAVLVAASLMNGCSLHTRARDHSDKYKSAEEYCEYWFGPCKEVEAYTEEHSDGSESTVHVMKDKEFKFEYTVTEYNKGYFLGSGDFAYYYIDEFLQSEEIEAISDEYDLEFENFAAGNEIKGSPSIRIHTDRVLSSEDNREILQTVMGMLDKFDSERKVFNKKHDNISVAVSVWSPPWEKDEKTGALYHVENDTFGDNYQDQ